MLIGIPKEPAQGETLVSATPDTVKKLIKLGYDVRVESGAGAQAHYPDEQYQEAGAQIVTREDAWAADIVTCLDEPPAEELALMGKGATLISRLNPNGNTELIDRLKAAGLTALAMDAVPRISRAQSMDVRSSMANIAGYRAIVEAANAFGRLFTGQVTAAGKVPPATVYVIGAGVAGLAAIGTANSMGAIVKATDVRPEVAEQVESMGGQFVDIPVKQESTDGYAKAMTADQEALALEVYTREAAAADIVITTALIPGRPAPRLITAEAVKRMKPGSVIVDLGAANGGNCELTEPDRVIQTENGVTIIGYRDLARRLPGQASQLYGQNVVNFFKLTTPGKDGVLVLNMEDEIVRGITVVLGGEGMWPPPPVKVSAAPAAPAQATLAAAEVEAEKPKSLFARWWWKIAAVVLFVWLILSAPPGMQGHFFVFALAVVVGFYVITNVTHSLHTPLMSVTNAISGIIIVGALMQIGSSHPAVWIMAFVATVVASINIFGGFTVTHRMLGMFRRS
ncbi:MAG: Re/Si-specific NAD(P)(+) transhydrogenase subunit alpha [Ancrocorticia sp.]|nr:Re/Si-specific NAD(P)(+) transhydrogenase subunit alpha [Ancrocorticia sp.]MCI1932094.1 Re/Si-specific NAD(P)(+) transhydrogenase subunit alpha [Ancrocorticia sp.]MCI1963455.1 Re/Si-specific NAD(P)(+) transhydrogenase subunit alpha [Ancrocorticia sp.]MCI2002351.1 Re/Si-specific NAD(P)(+) transhydrogenase subunit alpha [Ancrocorticia sp.]MCI2012221.1 Re/Si-specific NAD(P)(+) transhydrogenase subunit alpha [Ancrocorticia sp.]